MGTPHASWCQTQMFEGNPCDKPCRWKNPFVPSHPTHYQHVDCNAPCYFLKLPTELRQEIFRYLMPTRAIDSLAVYHSSGSHAQPRTGGPGSSLRTVFPMPLLYLYLGFNREVYEEIKDVFYSTATFTIDVSRDGVMLCGRRILVPTGPDGSSHYSTNQQGSDRFIRTFAWTAVRNYTVSITVEPKANARWMSRRRGPSHRFVYDWDEEVEMYDIRDFVAVVTSGILAKARLLCRLQVRLNLKNLNWVPELVLSNTKLIVGPFKRLRCVRKPCLVGTFYGDASAELYAQRHRPCNDVNNRCTTPVLSDLPPIIGPGMAAFDSFAADWERQLSTKAPTKILSKSPMTQLFIEFKAFHNTLANIMPHVVRGYSRSYLHRARVAREHEDIAAFRAVGAQLVQHWHDHLAEQERQRVEVNGPLQRMINADVYPCENQSIPAAEEAQKETTFIDLT